jgi:hypothetical protein
MGTNPLFMKSKGKALCVAPFLSVGRGNRIVLAFEDVKWTASKVSLNEVLKGNNEPIQINKVGDLVSGEMNLLRYKALNPQAQTIEVSMAGHTHLPPISEISVAA